MSSPAINILALAAQILVAGGNIFRRKKINNMKTIYIPEIHRMNDSNI